MAKMVGEIVFRRENNEMGKQARLEKKNKIASIAHKKLEIVFLDLKVMQIVVNTLFHKILFTIASAYF